MPRTTSMEESGRKRRRPALACTACRRRKMRCDQARPCSNCAQSTRYECIYPREGLRVAQATHTAPVRRLQPGPTLAPFLASSNPPSHLSPAVQQTRAQLSQSQITLPTPSHSSNAATAAATTPDVAALLSRINELESRISNIFQPLEAHRSAPGHTEITATQRSAVPENSSTERRFANQSSWINLSTLVSTQRLSSSSCSVLIRAAYKSLAMSQPRARREREHASCSIAW